MKCYFDKIACKKSTKKPQNFCSRSEKLKDIHWFPKKQHSLEFSSERKKCSFDNAAEFFFTKSPEKNKKMTVF